MNAEILSIRTKEKKSTLVMLEISSGGKRQKYTVGEGTYRAIGCPLSGEFIGEDELCKISSEDERRRSLQKALSLLSYADNNEKGLYIKLIRAGFSKDAARESVEECVRLGYIDEERQIERFIIKSSESLIGPYKISSKLLSRGYSPKQIFDAISALEADGKINFKESKNILIEEKLPENSSAEERKKLLYKYGYIK